MMSSNAVCEDSSMVNIRRKPNIEGDNLRFGATSISLRHCEKSDIDLDK